MAVPPPTIQQSTYTQEIRCMLPYRSDKCNISEYKLASSSILNMTRVSESNTNSENNLVSTNSSKNDIMKIVTALCIPKLSFNTLKITTDLQVWKSMMALKCAKNLKYQQLALADSHRKYTFNNHLSTEDSSTL